MSSIYGYIRAGTKELNKNRQLIALNKADVPEKNSFTDKKSARTLTARNISIIDLKNADLLSSNYKYFFVGVPAESSYFYAGNIYRSVNGNVIQSNKKKTLVILRVQTAGGLCRRS